MTRKKNPGPMVVWGLLGFAGLGYMTRRLAVRRSRPPVPRQQPSGVQPLWFDAPSVIEAHDRRGYVWVLLRALPSVQKEAEDLLYLLRQTMRVPVVAYRGREGADTPCALEYGFTPPVEVEVRQSGETLAWTCIPDRFFLDPEFYPRIAKTVQGKIPNEDLAR